MHSRCVYLDRFEVISPLGEGGVGKLFRAFDRNTGNTVVIKRAYNPRLNRCIENEIAIYHALGRVKGLAQFITAFPINRYMAFAMSYHAGRSLEDKLDYRIKHGKLFGLGQSVRLLMDICHIVERIHAARYVHCDLKPANVIMGRWWSTIICDLDAAVPVNFEYPEDRCITGTPCYLAPERYDSREPIQVTSDIYSLGCLWFECLTGAPPFMSKDVNEVRDGHLLGSIPTVDLQHRHTPLVNSLLARMLAKEPRSRFPTITSVLRALQPLAHT